MEQATELHDRISLIDACLVSFLGNTDVVPSPVNSLSGSPITWRRGRRRPLAQDALERAAVHAQAVRRMRHVAAALLVDAHDVLPAGPAEAQRRLRHRGQGGRSIQQRVDQLALAHRLRRCSRRHRRPAR